MKKIIPLLVVGTLIILGFGASASIDNNIVEKYEPEILSDDEIDQNQSVMNLAAMPVGTMPFEPPEIGFVNIQVAQSFIPTKKMLTRVELFIGKNSSAISPYVVSIREELTGNNLAVAMVDFYDLKVTPGETYYIVSSTANYTDNWYAWGGNNDSMSYPNGCMYYSIDEGNTWDNSSSTPIIPLENITWDMCFRTYGMDTAPELDISLKGGFGSISLIIDNVGDGEAQGVDFYTQHDK